MPNEAVAKAASVVSKRVARDFSHGTDRAMVVTAGAGAGKTALVVETVGACVDADLSTAVTAPTNEQVMSLVARCAEQYPDATFGHLHADGVEPSARILKLPNVFPGSNATAASHHDVVVATNDKFAYSVSNLGGFHRLILDEAYQADSTRYLCVAGLADNHLLVGDSGQLDPFSTADTSRWRGLPEDPLLTAVGVLRTNYPDTRVDPLPISRRLPPSAVPVIQPAFYGSDLQFESWTLPGERELRLAPGRARGHLDSIADAALDLAQTGGWAHIELPDKPVLLADNETGETIAAIVARLLQRDPLFRCEKQKDFRPLEQRNIAVAASHNDQVDLVRMMLNDANLTDVIVSTANKLQGLEYEVVVAWHPLAGLPDLDEFHLDPGRLCVMLTRHRQACIVVGRAGDREHARYQPPTTPAYLGWSPDPVLDGWEAHRHIFEQLEPLVVAA